MKSLINLEFEPAAALSRSRAAEVCPTNPVQSGLIRLHGKNDTSVVAGRCYYTNPDCLHGEMKLLTGRDPVCVNVTSKCNIEDFRNLSPMFMGPVECYVEGGQMATAISVEVAWQYSKVYCGHLDESGELVASAPHTFINMDGNGKIIGPSDAWFKRRDEAFSNPCFHPDHPEFAAHKTRVRHPFRGSDEIAFWWWNGRMLNRIQARQQIYATLYKKHLLPSPGFKRLQEIVKRGEDLMIFDLDGYDWVDLGMTPADCLRDANHSFGHGLCIAFLLQGIDPTNLVKSNAVFIPTIPLVAGDNGTKAGQPSGNRTTTSQGWLKPGESILNLTSEYAAKGLCDGPTFALGRLVNKVVTEFTNPKERLREGLVRPSGEERFKNIKRDCVIYSDPFLDVAGTEQRAMATMEICRSILKGTTWRIRLQSKHDRLLKVAEELREFKERIYFGFSIPGCLNDKMGNALELESSPVLKRLKALKQLQKSGFQTFLMVAPILPQSDYPAFVKELSRHLDLSECGGVWAAMDTDMENTALVLRQAGLADNVELIEQLAKDRVIWNDHAQSAFLALTKVVPAAKLHFLQPIEQYNFHAWEKHATRGAILLGKYAELIKEVEGKAVNLELVGPLSAGEKQDLAKDEEAIRKNGAQFITVGLALRDIRDRRLYRETHSSFDGYCLARFDFGRAYAYRLIGAAGLIKRLGPSPTGDPWPITSERQARELFKLDPQDRVEAIQRAVTKAGRRPMNAVWIQQAVMELKKNSPSIKPAKPTLPKITANPEDFHRWMRAVKRLDQGSQTGEILRLVEKAKTENSIVLPAQKIDLKLNWKDHYDSWTDGDQVLMTDAEKQHIEDLASDILALDPADAKKCWGMAHPPGCFAQTVIQVNPDVRHRYAKPGTSICLKICNLKRGKSEWARLHIFHTEYIKKLPGVPSKHIQQVLAVGPKLTAAGERGYLIQEWIPGETLETLSQVKIDRQDVLKILDDLFLGLVIPLWSQGTKWWDGRRSNYVFTPDRRLVMIDPDTLADYGAEIATTPNIYTKRNSCQRDEAISRYATLLIDLAVNCSSTKAESNLRKAVKTLCRTHLDPVFRFNYPLKRDWRSKAEQAFQQFRIEYDRLIS